MVNFSIATRRRVCSASVLRVYFSPACMFNFLYTCVHKISRVLYKYNPIEIMVSMFPVNQALPNR